MIVLETREIKIECQEKGCDNSPWRILRVYRPDLVGYEDFILCRKHFLAHRDIWRAEGERMSMPVRET
jgi:hypothetical protein